jgi:hypothetical protein
MKTTTAGRQKGMSRILTPQKRIKELMKSKSLSNGKKD